MSVYKYQMIFWHFIYRSVVADKNFDIQTCGTENLAKNRVFCDFSWDFWLKNSKNPKIQNKH